LVVTFQEDRRVAAYDDIESIFQLSYELWHVLRRVLQIVVQGYYRLAPGRTDPAQQRVDIRPYIRGADCLCRWLDVQAVISC
jgi:hypothetical protein